MEKKILSGILPSNINNRELVNKAKIRLLTCLDKNITFSSKPAQTLYKVIVAYYKATKSFIDESILKTLLIDNQCEPDLLATTLILFREVAFQDEPDEKFDFYLNRYLDELQKDKLQSVLLSSLDSLKNSKEELGETTVLAQVKENLFKAVFSEDSLINDEIPSGNIFDEADELESEYEILSQTGGVPLDGIRTGIKKLDNLVGPMTPGMLVIGAAASGEGKSFFATNLAYWAAVHEHKNVILFTAETSRQQYRRRLIVRHSNDLKFPTPISATRYKQGDFSPEEKDSFNLIIQDLKNSDYGKIDLVQVDNSTTLQTIMTYAEKQALLWPVDMIIIDYLSLIAPIQKRANPQQEESDKFKDAKRLATTFNKGKGVVLVTLHQLSFQAREKVKWAPGKWYSMRDVASTSEAAKSADMLFSILRDETMAENYELGFQVLKARDAEVSEQDSAFKLLADYDKSLIADLQE